MKKTLAILTVMASVATAQAFTINFEEGTDGANIAGVPGVTFTSAGGENWRYGDSRVPGYNTRSIDLGYGFGQYQHYGNLWAWLGTSTPSGKIDFTNNDGTWFQTGYTSTTDFYLEAYDSGGNLLDSDMGGGNYGGADMSYLRVDAPAGSFIDYVIVHDSGNYFLVDNMSGDTTNVGVPDGGSTLALLGLALGGMGLSRRWMRI